MKNLLLSITTAAICGPVFGTSFDLPQRDLGLILKDDPKNLNLRVPDPTICIPPLSFLENEQNEKLREDKIWNEIKRAKSEERLVHELAAFQLFQSDPFSMFVIVPDVEIDNRMVMQPKDAFESNMPVLNPDVDLHPLKHTKSNQTRTRQ